MKKIMLLTLAVAIAITLFWVMRDVTTQQYRNDVMFSAHSSATGIETIDDFFAYGLMGYNGISRYWDFSAVAFLFFALLLARKTTSKEFMVVIIVSLIVTAISIPLRTELWFPALIVVIIAMALTAIALKRENGFEASCASALLTSFLTSVWFGGTITPALVVGVVACGVVIFIVGIIAVLLGDAIKAFHKWIGGIEEKPVTT